LGGRTLQALSADIAWLEKKRPVAQEKEAESGIQKHADAMRHGMAHSASNAAATRTTAREADQNIDQVGDAICGQGASRKAKYRACYYGEDHRSDGARCQGMNGSAERHIDTECGQAEQKPAPITNQPQPMCKIKSSGFAPVALPPNAALINSKKRLRGPNSISERGRSEGIQSGSSGGLIL
jgi:hypothetical protein